jgi:predicted dienelactone hydrolase
LGSRVMAADSLTLRWGMFSQTVTLDDLDTFAMTGEVPSSLRLYRPLLGPNLQASLQGELTLDPAVSRVILDEVLYTPSGTRLLATLQALVPNLDTADLRVALERVSQSQEPLTFINLLRQLPQDTLEFNFGALLTLATQFQLAQMESAALGQLLRKELAQAPSDAIPASGVNPFSTGASSVERWDLVLRDRDRDRSIPIDIYWSSDTRGPLVVMSHGFGADRRFFAYLAQHLASHGLTVVSVEHPGSNVAALFSVPAVNEMASPTGSRVLPATEFLDRPRDITYVLNRLEKLNLYSYSLRNRLNTEQVTLIGHSLGGYTGLALAGAPLDLRLLDKTCQQLNPVKLSPADWLQCAALDLPVKYANLKDDRISQLIVTNPLTGLLFGEAGLSRVKVPTLMLASTRDSVTPMPAQQLGPFTQLAGPKYLITAIGGSHLSVGDPKKLNADLRHIPFMPELPTADTSNLRTFLQGLSLSFILQQTDTAEDYAGVLSADYAQAFSTPELPLGFNRTLPDSLLNWPRLQTQTQYQQASLLAYGPSLLHLEMISIRDQLQALQRQMVAYLRTSPPSLTALYWPRPLVRPPMQAHRPGSNRATP